MFQVGPTLGPRASRQTLQIELAALADARRSTGKEDPSEDERSLADVLASSVPKIRDAMRARKQRANDEGFSETVLCMMAAEHLRRMAGTHAGVFVPAISERGAEAAVQAAWTATLPVVAFAKNVSSLRRRRFFRRGLKWNETGLGIDACFRRNHGVTAWPRRRAIVLWRVTLERTRTAEPGRRPRAAERVAAIRRGGAPPAQGDELRYESTLDDTDACPSLHERIRARAWAAAHSCRWRVDLGPFFRRHRWPLSFSAAMRMTGPVAERHSGREGAKTHRGVAMAGAAYVEVIHSLLLVASRMARASGDRRIERAHAVAAASVVLAPVAGARGFAPFGTSSVAAGPVPWAGPSFPAVDVVSAAFPACRDESVDGSQPVLLRGPILERLPAGRYDCDARAADEALLDRLREAGAGRFRVFRRSGAWRRLGPAGLGTHGTCVLLLDAAGREGAPLTREAAALAHGCLEWVLGRLVRAVELVAAVNKTRCVVRRDRPVPLGSWATDFGSCPLRRPTHRMLTHAVGMALPAGLREECAAAAELAARRPAPGGLPAVSAAQVRRAMSRHGSLVRPAREPSRACEPWAEGPRVTRRCAGASGLVLQQLSGSRRGACYLAAVVRTVGSLLLSRAAAIAEEEGCALHSGAVAGAAAGHDGLCSLLVLDGFEGGSPLHRLLAMQRAMGLSRFRSAGEDGAVEAAVAAVPVVQPAVAGWLTPRPWVGSFVDRASPTRHVGGARRDDDAEEEEEEQ